MAIIGEEKHISDSSSNNDDVSVTDIPAEIEKTMAGQAPLPLQPEPPEPPGAQSKLEPKGVDIGSQGENDPLQHLSDREREIIKRQIDVPAVKVTIGMLYRYATANDMIIMAISALSAIGGGAALPLMTVSRVSDFQGLQDGD